MLDLVDKNKRSFFGAKLAGLLKSKKMKQNEFAGLIGASKNTVGDWVNGKRFPHPAQMKKICDALGVTSDEFSPFAWWEKEQVENEISEKRSAELESYAQQIGLRNEFFQLMVQHEDFIREFPFHGEYDHNPLMKKETGEEKFPLLKYQFEDDFGNRFMLVKEDLDFLKRLEDKTWKAAIGVMLVEKRNIQRKRIEKIIERCCQNPEIDRAEVCKRVKHFDITRRTETVTERDIAKVVREVVKEAGLAPVRVTKEDVAKLVVDYSDDYIMEVERLNHRREPTREEFKKAKAEAHVRRVKEIQEMIALYRERGWLIEEDESKGGDSP